MEEIATNSQTAKIYVRGTGTTGSNKYDITYKLNSGGEVTLGTGYSSTDAPFILLSDLAEGTYTLEVYAKDVDSGAKDSTPLTIKWRVVLPTGAKDTVSITSTDLTYSKTDSRTFNYKSSYMTTQDANANTLFTVQLWTKLDGLDTCFTSANVAANSQSASITKNLAGKADGTYKFQVYSKIVGDTSRSVIGTSSASATVEDSFVRDTTAPTITFAKAPSGGQGAKSSVVFEWTCNEVNPDCKVWCQVDGEKKSDATKSASRGYMECTSPFTITTKTTGTSSFNLYPVDKAGNTGSTSSVYSFFVDNSSPAAWFDNVDDSHNLATTQTVVNADQGYFPTAVGATTKYLTDGTTQIYEGTTTTYNPGGLTSDGAADITKDATNSEYKTVVQIKMDIERKNYNTAANEYGAILALRTINGKQYYNVMKATNSPDARLTWGCSHQEMKNCHTTNMACPPI